MPEPDEDAEEDTDDPFDLAAQMQRTLRRTQQVLARATELAEQQYDYAGAVKLLEGLPEGFRDSRRARPVPPAERRIDLLRKEVATLPRPTALPGCATASRNCSN